MGYTPQYDYSSLGVLLGTVGAGAGIVAGSPNIGPIGFVPLPGRSTADLFTVDDVGRIVTIMGAGASGVLLIARVAAFTDGQHITLDRNVQTSVADGISNTTIFRPIKTQEGSITFSENLTDATDGEFVAQQVNGEHPPAEGQPFLFTTTDPDLADSWGTFWGGEVDDVETKYEGYQNGSQKATTSNCKCVSYKAVLQRRVMLGKQYSSTDAATVTADLVKQAKADYIDSTASVNPAVTLLTVEDYTYIDQAIDAMVALVSAGVTKYFWYIDHWRMVHLISQSSYPAPWSVSDTGASDGNVMVDVSRVRTRDKMSNQVYAKASKALGDMQTVNVANSFNGSALPFPRRSVTLTAKAGITPKVVVNGTPKVVWVAPTDPRTDTTTTITIPAGYDWAWPEGSDYVFCDVSRPGIPSGGTAVVTFYPDGSAIGHDLNADSVSERAAVQGGSGLHETVETVDAPMSVAELQTWSTGHVQAFGLVPESVNVMGFRSGLRRGMGLTVHLIEIGATVNYIVESVQMTEEGGWVKWTVKASIGAFIGDWTRALLTAFGGDSSLGGAAGLLSGGSVLEAQFLGGNGITTIPYAAKVLVNGGTGPYGYHLATGSGPLPTGVTLDATTGLFSGNPSASGTYSFTIAVLDAVGDSTTCAGTIIVSDVSGGDPLNIGTLTTFTATDNTSSRWVDGPLHAVVDLTIACASYPKRITLESTSPQYGRTWHGWIKIDGPVTFSLGAKESGTVLYPPTVADETVTFRAVVGQYDKNVLLSSLSGGAGVQTDTATVHSPGAYTNTGSSTATAPTINYYKTTGGAYVYTVTFQINLPLSDPKFWFASLYNQTGTGTGGGFTPAGANAGNTRMGDWASPTAFIKDQDHADIYTLDTDVTAGNVNVTLGPWNVPSDGINTIRLTMVLATRKDDGSGGTKTQQYTWPSAAQYVDVVLDPDKAQISAVLLDPTTLGSGLKVASSKLQVSYGGGTKDDGTGKVTLDVSSTAPLYLDLSAKLNMQLASDFIVTGGVLNQNFVNLAKSVNFGSEFTTAGGFMAVNAIAVNKLAAGTALFTGTATFQFSTTGGKVQIGSTGLTMSDNASSPAYTLAISSSGITLQRVGFANMLQLDSSSLRITNGANSIALTAGALTMNGGAITGGSLSIATSSGTIAINSGSTGVTCTNGANFASFSQGGAVVTNGSTTSFINATGVASPAASFNGLTVSSTSSMGGVNITSTYFGYGVYSPSFPAYFQYLVVGGVIAVDSSVRFTGAGVFCPSYNVTCSSLTVGGGGINYNGSFGASQNLTFKDSFGGFCTISVNGGFASSTRMNFNLGGYLGQI